MEPDKGLWELKNPPEFKYGDIVNASEPCETKFESVKVLEYKCKIDPHCSKPNFYTYCWVYTVDNGKRIYRTDNIKKL